MRKWDNKRDIIVADDAVGVVAPALREGIYCAMTSDRHVVEAAHAFITTGNPKALAQARKRFMREHGKVFWILGVMQHF